MNIDNFLAEAKRQNRLQENQCQNGINRGFVTPAAIRSQKSDVGGHTSEAEKPQMIRPSFAKAPARQAAAGVPDPAGSGCHGNLLTILTLLLIVCL